MAGSLKKSRKLMKAVQNLVMISSVQRTMHELSEETMKAGIVEEVLEDTFESLDDLEGMEEATDVELINFV